MRQPGKYLRLGVLALGLTLLAGCASSPWRARPAEPAAPSPTAARIAKDPVREARLAELERFFVFSDNDIRPSSAHVAPAVFRRVDRAPAGAGADPAPMVTRVSAAVMTTVPDVPDVSDVSEVLAVAPAAHSEAATAAPPISPAGPVAQPLAATERVSEPLPVVHTVAAGETLWDIARAHLGSGARWREIAAANPSLANPDRIFPGQYLAIPAA